MTRPRSPRRRGRDAAGVTAALLVAALASPLAAAPYDIVPRGDIAYDLLGSLAAAGRVPGATLRDFSRGDRLYTRREIARFVLSVREAADSGAATLTPEQRTQLKALEIEFEPELRLLPGYAGRSTANDSRGGAFTGQLKLRQAADPAAFDAIVRVSGTVPVGRDGYATVSAGSYRDEWYSEEGMTRGGYPPVETAFVRVNTRALDLTVGRKPLRWGPGFSGALLLADEAPSVPMVQVEKGFRLPGWFGKTFGRLYFTQFAGEFFEDDVAAADPIARGTRRYLFGRRIETQEAGRFTVSIGEAFKSTRLPDAFYAFTLPSFYFYQDTYTRYPGDPRRPLQFLATTPPYQNTSWLNYLGNAQVAYRADSRGTVLYSDLLLDDIRAPEGIGKGNDTPRKIGFQLGAYAPAIDRAGRYAARLEYTTIDTGTYLNASPPVYWSNNGRPLGYAGQTNADVFFGRVDAAFSPRFKAAAEGYVRRAKDETGGDPGRLGAVSPAFDADRFSLFATYTLRRDAFVGFRLDRTSVTPSAPGSAKQTDTRAELNFGVGF